MQNPERMRKTGLETSEIMVRTNRVVFDALQGIGQEEANNKLKAKSEAEKQAVDARLSVIRRFILNDAVDKHYNPDGSLKEKAGGQQ
jgi:hypothetical protein